jgi:hypothetical protein
MTVDIEKMKALALAATPGPWNWWTSNSVLRLTGADDRDGGVLHAYARGSYGDISCSEVNQAFIAATNPASVLELIAEVERLRAGQRPKDHNVRQLVNDLRDIATTFHATQQLRARISGAVGQFIDANYSGGAAGTEKDAERLYRAAPRGIGKDWTPGCMCCGGDKNLYNNASFFVQSRESGEAIVAMFEHGAFLDWREHEPNWIQVKVGACDAHLENLVALVAGVRQGPQQDGKTCISRAIVDAAIGAHTKAGKAPA